MENPGSIGNWKAHNKWICSVRILRSREYQSIKETKISGKWNFVLQYDIDNYYWERWHTVRYQIFCLIGKYKWT